MNILFDTSVLVAAMVEAHPMHERALPWLQRVQAGLDVGIIATHSIAELYAVLTKLPVRPPISPAVARRLIQQNVLEICRVVSLSEDDYVTILRHLSDTGIVGGATYDALILYTALKADVDCVVTSNEADFRRIYPDLADKIVAP
jgi:predicted nucleic acid-binding protein